MPNRRRSPLSHWPAGRRAAAAFGIALAAVTAATATAAPLGAQARPDSAATSDSAPPARGRATVFGTVRAPNGAPVEDAEVTVVGSDARRGRGGGDGGAGAAARSGPGGAFRLDGVLPGRYFLRARRLGYEPLYFAATLGRDQARRIDLELTPLPAQLAEVTVRARSGYTWREDQRLRGFVQRQRAGWGRFLTRDDLRSYRGMTISQALVYAAPMFTCRDAFRFAGRADDPWGTRGAGAAGGFAGTGWAQLDRGCGVHVSVDGQLPLPGDVVGDFPLDMIEAVEVYRDQWAASTFLGAGLWRGGPLVVLWTGTDSDDR